MEVLNSIVTSGFARTYLWGSWMQVSDGVEWKIWDVYCTCLKSVFDDMTRTLLCAVKVEISEGGKRGVRKPILAHRQSIERSPGHGTTGVPCRSSPPRHRPQRAIIIPALSRCLIIQIHA
jgi:hypothetical protein